MMKLLSVFEEQIMFLVDEGRPSLPKFLYSLESNQLLLPSEIQGLRTHYGLEDVSSGTP